MILVIGQVPRAGQTRHGMLQRIASIDRRLQSEERIYLEPSVTSEVSDTFALEEVAPKIRRAAPNLLISGQWRQVVALAEQADAIIVHSVYWAQKVLPLYATGKVMTDLHGAVPEELAWMGEHVESARMALIEALVTQQSRAVLVVSEAMATHVRSKYPAGSAPIIHLPVVSEEIEWKARSPAPPWRLLYAGFSSVWQNADEMLAAIKATSVPWSMELLTDDVPYFEERAVALGLRDRVVARSVSPEEVIEVTKGAHLAFVLREDHIVNRVACPTKLAEALAAGAVPILKSPHIGDFLAWGYRYVAVEDFIAGRMPTAQALEQMARHNLTVARRLQEAATAGTTALWTLLKRPPEARQGASDGSSLDSSWGEFLQLAGTPRLRELSMALERAEGRIAELNRTSARAEADVRQAQLAETEARTAQIEAQSRARALEDKVKWFSQTRSWKVTAPLRWATQRMKRK